MKKFFKILGACLAVLVICFSFSACENETKSSEKSAEKVELTTAMIDDVEFENSESTTIKQNEKDVVIGGRIDAMSKSQKNKYGVDEVTHVVTIKVTFDRERTISSFEIKGDITKVYADEKDVPNYCGKLSDLLDNEPGEDAYCNLILSASTKKYTLTAKYSDGEESSISLKIDATLATAKAE